MSGAFEIEDGVLKKYHGAAAHAVIPDGVKKIGARAFKKCAGLASVAIPDGVMAIGKGAFEDCANLVSIAIPDTVVDIGEQVFCGCKSLASIDIPESVTEIGQCAFNHCTSLSSIVIPDGVKGIGWITFSDCASLSSVVIPDSVEVIGAAAFADCPRLTSIIIPDSVVEIDEWAFARSPTTVICREGSHAHRECVKNRIAFVFDYQYEAFNGLLPQGYEKLASPFLADEERPYVFVSYSHRDRDEILPIIKGLYEDGWRIWYDEGLTIGDRYDETLEAHVRNCSAFLLFLTASSRQSAYIRENEVPWAVRFGKPVIECVLDEGMGYGVRDVVASVLPSDIGRALERVGGLVRGELRVAEGVSVVVDPATRDMLADGFACCLYSVEGAVTARAIMLEAKRAGCVLHDAVEEKVDPRRLRDSACLVAFLDKAFLQNVGLTWFLAREYLAGRDVAICALEEVEDVGLPERLGGLDKEQWLDFAHGISADMCTKLARYLQERRCRDAAVLPGFEYEKTDGGIVITRYTGLDPSPRIDAAYGGVSVVRIDNRAFEGCVHLEEIAIPDGVVAIGGRAFCGCLNLASVTIPDGLAEVGEEAFSRCTSLTSIAIPDSVAEIGERAFENCENLTSAVIPDGVRAIGKEAFIGCANLAFVTIPATVMEIGGGAFKECTSLTSIVIPYGITEVEHGAFEGCSSLSSVIIPDSVTTIGPWAFSGCKSLPSVTLPGGLTEIGASAFSSCLKLTSIDIPDSVTAIGPWAFHSCKSLSSVVVPDGVRRVRAQLFGCCTSLTSVAIPDGVTVIQESAFQGCSNLLSVVVPDSVVEIERNAFADCERLTVTCLENSYTWNYCKDNDVPVKSSHIDNGPA